MQLRHIDVRQRWAASRAQTILTSDGALPVIVELIFHESEDQAGDG